MLSSSEHSGVPEDSQPPTFPSVGLHPHTWPKWGCDTRDEEPEPQKVHACLEIEPPRAWYYCISSNFRTLVILLQIDLTFGDEPETVYESCYETKDIFIFTWSSIPGVGHYCRLRNLIHRLPPNNMVDYLVRTTRHILDFLQL